MSIRKGFFCFATMLLFCANAALADPVTAVNISLSGMENTPFNFDLAPSNVSNPSPLAFQLVSGPAHGTLALNSTGTGTYSPAAGFFGSDSFTYDALDSEKDLSNVATVSITIAAPTAPTALNGSFSAVAGVTTPYTLSGQDSNSPPSPLMFILVSGPLHGSLVLNANGQGSYTALAGFNSTDSFTFKVQNGFGLDSAVATETVLVTPTSAVPEPGSLMLLASGLAATAGLVRRRIARQ